MTRRGTSDMVVVLGIRAERRWGQGVMGGPGFLQLRGRVSLERWGRHASWL
jgi:hypothetical protein